MLAESRCRFIWIYYASVGISIFFASCGGVETSREAGLYHEASCSPPEVISQSRQKLSSLHFGTTDPVAEGKGLTISTADILEESGKKERLGKYKLVVLPIENANKSTLTLHRIEGKSKGIRERKWYDDDLTASEPQSAQQIWKQIESICPKQQ